MNSNWAAQMKRKLDAALVRVAELVSGLHEIAASLPVHESKDLDADNVDEVCRAVKLALRRYADEVEQMDALVEELEARLSRRNERIRDFQKCQDRLRELDKVDQSGEGGS